MKSILVRMVFVLAITQTIAQILDSFFWDDDIDDEQEFLFDDDENSTSLLNLVHMSSTELKLEKELLEESSEMIVDEVSNLMSEDSSSTEEEDYLNQIIADHTIQLYNVLSQIKHSQEPRGGERRFNFKDIFIWSNVSNERIKDILEDYYKGS